MGAGGLLRKAGGRIRWEIVVGAAAILPPEASVNLSGIMWGFWAKDERWGALGRTMGIHINGAD